MYSFQLKDILQSERHRTGRHFDRQVRVKKMLVGYPLLCEVFVLYYFGGMSLKDIAKRLNLTPKQAINWRDKASIILVEHKDFCNLEALLPRELVQRTRSP